MKRIQRTLAGILACLLYAAAVPSAAAGAEDAVYLPLNRDRTEAVYSDLPETAYASCNEVYYDAWQGEVGSYLAYDLNDIPESQRQAINVAWYSGAWNSYDYTVKSEAPGASLSEYKLYVNKAPGGAYPEEGWEEVVHETDITTHSGQNLIDFAGYGWVKLEVLGIQNGRDLVSLNVDIHDCSSGFVDSWIFYGDSITAGGMITFSPAGGTFADLIHGLDARFYPAQENGGIGGIFSTDGKNNIDRWLAKFPGQYVSIAYGTNDCWGNQTGEEQYYENTVYMIEAVQAAGKTAVLPKIPYSVHKDVSPNVASYNAMIDRIYEEFPDVIKGPDFEAYFQENPEGLSSDGVHPNDAGYEAMRRLWAETMYETVYQNRSITPENPVQWHLLGDVNNDDEVSAADVVMLSKWLALKDTELTLWECADMNADGIINATDLTLLKQELMIGQLLIQQPILVD